MKRSIGLLLVVIFVSSGTLWAQNELSLVNNTNFQLDLSITQTGPDLLAGTEWWAKSNPIRNWQPDSLMLTVEDSSIVSGDTVEFTAAISYLSDSIWIQQRIVQSPSGKEVSYKVSGTSFVHPWVSDLLFHEELILLDTVEVLLKYKIDDSDPGDLMVAIHGTHIYSIDPSDFENPNVLNVMAYNIQITPVVSGDWELRIDNLPKHFSPWQDVVILEELFVENLIASNLTPAMEAAGFMSDSGILNPTTILPPRGNGGVIIYSKWPIEKEKDYEFDACVPASSDCLSAKGVKYARINKFGKLYHLFGTHMQAGGAGTPEKVMQYGELDAFIESRSVAASEPVIFGGDFNTGPRDTLTYEAIRDSTEAVIPHAYGHYTTSFKTGGSRFANIIDHVWLSRENLIPVYSDNKVITFRGVEDPMWGVFDFSDHRTAIGRFEYPGPLQEKVTGNICPDDTLTLKLNPMPGVVYTWYKDGSVISVPGDELIITTPTASDAGDYTCSAEYTTIYGNTSDSLIQAFFPDGPDTVVSNVTFELASVSFVSDCSIGRSVDIERPELNIYPGISDGLFYIRENFQRPSALQVFNSLGQLVKSETLMGAEHTLNLEGFGKGVYIVSIQMNGRLYNRRLVLK